MKTELEARIAAIVKKLFNEEITVELTRPDEKFGDYATNVALQLAKKLGGRPDEIAGEIASKFGAENTGMWQQLGFNLPIEIQGEPAGPGFINFTLSDNTLLKAVETEPAKSLAGQTIVAEYSDPNPFKVLHAGHLYTSVVGDSIANLLEQAGAQVHRVNFGGDVGLHVAKTMWGMLHKLGGANEAALSKIASSERADWLAQAYIAGNDAYDKEPNPDILLLNRLIYDYWGERQFAKDSHQFKTALNSDEKVPVANIYRLYEIGRQWSYDYFNEFYARIGSKFEKYYPESETAPIGLKTVREHIGAVYEDSYGAIIFNGEKHDLHTRVFINSEGLPTYEAKDVGLIIKKWQDYHFDRSIVITGNDIVEYMKVVLKSIEQFQPELAARTTHLTHGIVRLAGGTKMSSRKGNILRATDVLEAAAAANKMLTDQANEATALGAVKYAFLKSRMGGDIIYDPQESVSLEGNSGPYLQYAHARSCSILRKAEKKGELAGSLEADERSLLRKISEYPEVVDKATTELMPHHICTYLYELAQIFNRFYEKNRVIGSERESLRLGLVAAYADRLKHGLGLLGIVAPEKM